VKQAEKTQFGSIEQYLRDYSDEMAWRVEQGAQPMFDPLKDPYGPAVLDLLANPGNFGAPLPAQAVSVEGMLRALDVSHCVDLTGEMGTGKTPMGCWVARGLAFQWNRPLRVVVTCPNQLVAKWKDHFERILPGCRARVVKGVEDLIHLKGSKRRPAVTEVYIIGRDKGKLSYAWRPAAIRKKQIDYLKDSDGNELPIVSETFHCPDCGTKQVYKGKKDEVLDATMDYFADPRGRLRERRTCCGSRLKITRTRHDDGGNLIADFEQVPCKSSLWQAHNGLPPKRLVVGHPKDPGRWVDDRDDPNQMPRPGISPRRMSPAEFIWRYRIFFDLYIADEVHELSAEGSLQGQMYGWLVARSRKVINATGTLSGGYAANLLFRLWRTTPARLKADGMDYGADGFAAFVASYGVLQTTRKYVQQNGESIRDMCLGKGKCVMRRERSLPGISPLLYARYLLPTSVFVRLREMHDDLPEFYEHVHTIPLCVEAAVELDRMMRQFKDHAARQKASGAPCRAWSAARAAFLRWPDRPWPAQEVFDYTREGMRIKAFDIGELSPDQEFAKERRLRRLILRQRALGRKVCVFTEMTGPRWDVTKRLVDYLGRYGIRCAVLKTQQDGGPKPEERSDWIAARESGVDVLICNPHLVKTGLDLYEFPTIAFYYCGDSTYTLRQASRRAWRLGQKLPCEVHYFVYGRVDQLEVRRTPPKKYPDVTCIQSAALSLMAQKMEASLALEGDFSAEGLAAMAESTDMATALAKVIAGTLQVEGPQAAFARYRRKLEESMPSIVRKREEPAAEQASSPLDALMEACTEPVGREEPPAPEPEPIETPEPVVLSPRVVVPNDTDLFGEAEPIRMPAPKPAAAKVATLTPLPPSNRKPTTKRSKSLDGLLALVDLVGESNPAMASKLNADIEALRRLAK
jgi:hypothetical protein